MERGVASVHPGRLGPTHRPCTQLAPLVHGRVRRLGRLRQHRRALPCRRGLARHRRPRVAPGSARRGHQLRLLPDPLDAVCEHPRRQRHADEHLPAVLVRGRPKFLPKHRLPQRRPARLGQLHRRASARVWGPRRQQRSEQLRQPALRTGQPRHVHRNGARQPLLDAAEPLAEHQPQHVCGPKWRGRIGNAAIPEPGMGAGDAVWVARQREDGERPRRLAVHGLVGSRGASHGVAHLHRRHERPLPVGLLHGVAVVRAPRPHGRRDGGHQPRDHWQRRPGPV